MKDYLNTTNYQLSTAQSNLHSYVNKNQNSSNKLLFNTSNLKQAECDTSNLQVPGFAVETTSQTDKAAKAKIEALESAKLDAQIIKCKNLRKLASHIDIKHMKLETKKALLSALKWAEENNYEIRITSAYRNAAKQKVLYRKNPAIADTPNHSMHCKGFAFDIGIYPKGSLQKIRNPKIYLNLAKELRKEGFDIYNGREFPDSPKNGTEWWHFQISKGDGFLFAKSKSKKK